MKYFYAGLILFCVTTLSVFMSCSKKPDLQSGPEPGPVVVTQPPLVKVPELPVVPFNYVDLNLPSFLTVPYGGVIKHTINGYDNTPADNLVTNDGATLGRVLFYETALSFNRSISCASCHLQQFGFSDTAVKSAGFAGGHTRRNSMTLINNRWYERGHYFADERAGTLEAQTTMPIFDPVEMGLGPDTLLQRVANLPYYKALFEKAFGNDSITVPRIAKALAQFVRSIVSTKSKYDVARAEVLSPASPFPAFTAQENRGKDLFFAPITTGGGCFTCHTTDAFVSESIGPQNIGLDSVNNDDLGVFETFPTIPTMHWKFKQTTLKNVALTAPYMHDGRFRTLDDVLNHYSDSIKNSPTLAGVFRGTDGRPKRLNFSPQQKQDIIAFLNTLTDNTIATEPKWSNPFR